MRLLRLLLPVALVVGSASLPQAVRAQSSPQPSFDCAKVGTAVERAICGDSALAAADALMARLYARAQVSAFGQGSSNQLAVQRKWLAERDEACRSERGGDLALCLRRMTEERTSDLAVAVVFDEPDLALSTLHRLRPGWAPLVEAVYLYAGEPVGTGWQAPAMAGKRARMLALLEPYARRFSTDADLSYGRDILKDLGISDADGALASESAFASFVEVASAYSEDATFPVMPCAAVVRHPGLLAATGAVFGSTLDSFVVKADCAATLPPRPKLDQLVDRIVDGWPECEGTIRFAAYRAFDVTVNETMLATEARLAGDLPNAPIPRRRGVSAGLVDAAVAELATYYQGYGRASATAAPDLARIMVRRVMESAHECY